MQNKCKTNIKCAFANVLDCRNMLNQNVNSRKFSVLYSVSKNENHN